VLSFGAEYFVFPSKNLKITTNRTVMLPAVLYGSHTMWEERRLRVFESRVLWRKFGPKGDEITKEWRKLHYGELNDLYSSPNTVRVTKSRRM